MITIALVRALARALARRGILGFVLIYMPFQYFSLKRIHHLFRSSGSAYQARFMCRSGERLVAFLLAFVHLAASAAWRQMWHAWLGGGV